MLESQACATMARCFLCDPPRKGGLAGWWALPPSISRFPLQERRRAERAEQQRFRTEKERERQAKLAVGATPPWGYLFFGCYISFPDILCASKEAPLLLT